jgi:hypothetical protein
MAGKTLRAPTWNRAVGFLVLSGGLIAVAFAFRWSLDPKMYFPGYDLSRPAPFEFPTVFFAMTCGLIAVYTLAELISLARMRWPMWLRSLVILMVLVPWTMYASRFFLHMPGFWLVHLLYLWIVVVVIGAAFLLSLAFAVHQRLTRGDSSHA